MIINPNSSHEMAAEIQKTAENFVRGDCEVVCKSTPGAPDFIETYEDMIHAAPGMIQLARESEGEYNGFVIGCHYDPNLDAMKEILGKPVVGIGEASMKLASMLGHRFSIITTDTHSIPIHEDLIRKYHLHDLLSSVRAPRDEWVDLQEEEKYLRTAQLAVQKDLAEVIVLGCAGITRLDKRIQKQLGVPVLDGVVCALIFVKGLMKYDAMKNQELVI